MRGKRQRQLQQQQQQNFAEREVKSEYILHLHLQRGEKGRILNRKPGPWRLCGNSFRFKEALNSLAFGIVSVGILKSFGESEKGERYIFET